MATSKSTLAAATVGAIAGAVGYAAYLKARLDKAPLDKVLDTGSIVEKAIIERRSMFLPDLNGEDAPEEAIKRMLEAANWAPTHGKTQPWRFTVFRRSTGQVAKFLEVLLQSSQARLSQSGVSQEEQAALEKAVQKHAKKVKDMAKCSHVIAICMKRQALVEKLMPEWEEHAAVACAVQNAHVLACQLGVAMYWTSGGTEGPLKTAD
jgi:nitroreductase